MKILTAVSVLLFGLSAAGAVAGDVAGQPPAATPIDPRELKETENCNMDDYRDQIELTLCSSHNYDIADKRLNDMYKEKMAHLGNDTAKLRLRTSERRWLKMLHKQCEEDIKTGGTSRPMLIFDCSINLIYSRIDFLKSCTDVGCQAR